MIKKSIFLPETTPREIKVLYGQAVLMVAGADGDLTLEEQELFYSEASRLGADESIIDEWRNFDWGQGDLDATTQTLKSYLSDNSIKLLIYCAIRIAMEDSSYPLAEQDAVRKAAELLDVDDKTVVELEILASMDKNVSDLKYLTFSF